MLIDYKLNHRRAESQLTEFRAWLDENDEFGERSVVGFLKERIDLCLLIQVIVGKGLPDRYKFEFGIQGAFRADLVVGNSSTNEFVLIEFEGGEEKSIFTRGTLQIKNWATQIQHAFSQISDWTWAKNDNQKSLLYKSAFGSDYTSETYVIICGRSTFLNGIDYSRLKWRSNNTIIAASSVYFWTYDDLYIQVSAILGIWRAALENP